MHHPQPVISSMHEARTYNLICSSCVRSIQAEWYWWQINNLHKFQACCINDPGIVASFSSKNSQPEAVLRALLTLTVLEGSIISVSLSKHQRQQAVIDATGHQLNVFLNMNLIWFSCDNAPDIVPWEEGKWKYLRSPDRWEVQKRRVTERPSTSLKASAGTTSPDRMPTSTNHLDVFQKMVTSKTALGELWRECQINTTLWKATVQSAARLLSTMQAILVNNSTQGNYYPEEIPDVNEINLPEKKHQEFWRWVTHQHKGLTVKQYAYRQGLM